MEQRPALSVAFVPGVTVTKWTRIWAERHPEIPLLILPTDQPQQTSVVLEGTAHLSFVRLPLEADGLHVIPLYRERAVAVAAKDHVIAAADAVTLADLAGEPLQSAGAKHHDRGPFDLVAAGVGVLVVPQSIARMQSRKDVVVRPITDAPETQIALVWRATPASVESDADAGSGVDSGREVSDATSAELIADFIGIVRGRTAQSSRSTALAEGSATKEQPAKAKAAAKGAARGGATGAAKSASKGATKGAAKSAAKGTAKGTTKAGAAAQRSGAAHAANRKRAESRKKHRGR